MEVNTIIKTIPIPLLILAVLAGTAASAQNSISVMSAPEVKQMIESGDATIIHVLSHIEYLFQHIPGSINIPVDQVASSTRLPDNKHKPIVFYCMGYR
jgi:rhodanese-related sulfurtransferase